MKKTFNEFRRVTVALLISVICSILILSCQDDEVTSSATEVRLNKSEISQIEQETGFTFYKRELTIADESGENKVTIRVAGRDESMLVEYLKSRTFSIQPVYTQETTKALKMPFQEDKESTLGNYDERYESTVIIEFVNQKLKEGVTGVRFHDQPNPLYKIDNSGRVKYYNNTSHISNNWPSALALQAYARIDWFVWYKGRWYQSWSPWFGDTWCCDQYNTFDVDGPYRVRLNVAYDYYSDYYYEYFY